MRNIFTLAVAVMASVAMMAQTPAIELTAKSSEIGAWNTTYDNVTISVEGAALTGKKPCGVTEKENVMSISGSDSQWIEISSTDGLSKIIITGSGNNSGNTDWAAPLCACASAPFDNTIIGILEVHYTGYDHECIENEILLPEGTKSVRIYRRMKVNSEGTEVGSGSNWTPSTGTGNQTFNITYLAVYAGAATPSTDPVSSVTLAGPEAVYVGQTASYTASPDQKATAYKWTVDGIEQDGATSNKFEYSPAVGTYAIQAFAKNEYNSDWVASNIINLVVSEKTVLEQVPVTAATVWDWTKAASVNEIKWEGDQKDADPVLLANVDGMNNDANFNSQALLFSGQYPIRDGKYCQGPWISFKTTVPGYVQVDFSNTGTKDEARYVAVNGVVNTEVGTLNTTTVTSANIAVEAGDVVIEGSFETYDPANTQYLRINKITFNTGEIPVEPSHDATLKSLTYGSDQTSVPDFSADKLSYSVVLPSDYVGGAPSIQAELNDEKAKLDISQATSLPGTASAKVTAEDGTTKKTYTVSFSKEGEEPATVAVTGVALDKTSLTLKVGQISSLIAQIIPSDATNQNVSWSSSNTAAATVAAGVVTAKAEGTAKITVKTEDGGFEATCEVTVQKDDTPTPPSTGLTLHEPGVYEEKSQYGGYETALTTYDHRLYEVYYCFKGKLDGSSIATAATTPGGSYLTDKNTRALDGWFTASPNSMEESGASAMEEFKAGNGNWKMKGDVFQLHVKGYDLFKILAADNDPANPEKVFHVFLNGKEQTMTYSKNPSTRAFELSPTQEYLIEVKAGSSTQIKFYGFSLREAQIPMVSHLKGNDSTQVVPQIEKIRAITYYTKYNIENGTRVIWENGEATGITLSVKASTEAGDTLVLGGQALCPVGVYPFHVSSFDGNGVETKRLPSGKITVTSDIHAVGIPEVEVYEGEAMEELKFTYHALSADDITIDWKGNKPNGIDGHGADGKYYISGTPTQQGDYPFTISVKGGNSVDGFIKVLPPVVGDNLVLYLFTNGDKKTILEKDGVADYIAKEMGYTFVPRKALSSGLRSDEDYQRYKWVLISEDANATNEEVLALTQRSAILPVLNMKAFSYAEERLSWGDPDNGSLTDNGRYITVQRDDHPIFQALGKKHGDKIQVLTKIDEKGLMPIDINLPGTHCLATSLPRSKTDYYSDGKDPYTFLHDVPAGMRGGKKYICLPIAMSSSKNLTTAGKDLVKAVVNYLLNDEQSLTVPNLQITSFIIDGISGNIDQSKNRITFEIDLKEHFDVDKYAIKPTITLADGTYTHVTTASGEVVDFSESWSFPVAYEVSDYINRRVYEVAIRFFSSEGIEDVYAVGDWVNIYDIFGRKVSTTNEDIYHMVLPRGVYVIVTETGQTFKIMR